MLNSLSGEMVRYQIQDRVREVEAERATRAARERSQGWLQGSIRAVAAAFQPERRTFTEPSPLRNGTVVEAG